MAVELCIWWRDPRPGVRCGCLYFDQRFCRRRPGAGSDEDALRRSRSVVGATESSADLDSGGRSPSVEPGELPGKVHREI